MPTHVPDHLLEEDKQEVRRDEAVRPWEQVQQDTVKQSVKYYADLQRYVNPRLVSNAYRDVGAFEMPSEVRVAQDEAQEDLDPVLRAETRDRREMFQREYVRAFEDAWSTYRGRIPDSFFYNNFSYEDLIMVAGAVPEDVMVDMHMEAETAAQEQLIQDTIQERVDKELEQAEAEESFWARLGGSFNPASWLPGTASDRADAAGRIERERRIRRQVEQELLGTGGDPVDPSGWSLIGDKLWNGITAVGEAGMAAGDFVWDEILRDSLLGQNIRLGATFGGQVLESSGEGLDIVFDGWFSERFQHNVSEQQAELNESLGNSDAIRQQMLWQDGRRAWEELPEEEREFRIEEANGSEMQAMGFFIDDHVNDPDVQEQMSTYVQELDDAQRAELEQLDESHFDGKHAWLEGLAWWGNMAGDVAVGAQLLWLDPEFTTASLLTESEKFMNEVAEYDHSPAEMLGWDGTALGIAYDLGMTGIFDPLNLVFGAGAVSRVGRGVQRTAAQVNRMIKSSGTQKLIRQVTRGLQSSDTSLVSMMSMSGLDGQAQRRLMQLGIHRRPWMRRGKDLWRKNYPTAQEMPLEAIARLMPEDAAAAGAGKAGAAITKRGGLKRPIEVIVDSNGNVALSEFDHSAVKALSDMGEEFAPVRVRRLDDTVDGYTPEQVSEMRRVLDEVPDEGTASTRYGEGSQEQTANMWETQDIGPNDRVIGEFELNGETYTVKQAPTMSRVQTLSGETRPNRTLTYVQNSDGQLAGGYDEYTMIQAPGHKGLMHKALEAAEAADASFLPRLVERALNPTASSFTEDAVRFVKNAINQRLGGKQFMDDLGGTAFDGKALFGDKFKVPGEVGANLSPTSMLDESILLSDDIAEEVEKIYRGSLMRNGKLRGLGYTAPVRGMQSMVRNLAEDSNFFRNIDRMFTQYNLTTTLNLNKVHGTDDALDYIMRLWGEDTAQADRWAGELMDMVHSGAAGRTLAAKNADTLTNLKGEKQEILEQIGGNPYGSLSDDSMEALLERGEVFEQHLDDLRQKALRDPDGPAAKELDALQSRAEPDEMVPTPGERADLPQFDEGAPAMTPEEEEAWWALNEMKKTKHGKEKIARSLDPELNPGQDLSAGKPLYRGTHAYEGPAGAGAARIPDEGDIIEMAAESASDDISRAAGYGGRNMNEGADEIVGTEPDLFQVIYEFPENTPAHFMRGVVDEGEHIVSGKFRVSRVEDIEVTPTAGAAGEPSGQVKVVLEYVEGAAPRKGMVSAGAIEESLEGQYLAYSQLRKRTREINKELRRIEAAQIKNLQNSTSHDEIYELLDNMIDDYIETQVKPLKGWQKAMREAGLDPAKDKLPRDWLAKGMRKGQEIEPGPLEEFASFARMQGIDQDEVNRLYQMTSGKTTKGYDFGVSPLDLAVARRKAGSAYTRFTHKRTVHAIRQSMHTLINVWMIDKVFRPATAAVVTMDEAMRIVNLYGHRAVERWLLDKANHLAARSVHQFRNPTKPVKAFFEKDAIQKGASALPARAQERIRRLQDWPDHLKQAERSFYDQHGIGYADIAPDDPMYLDHAQRWAAQFTENPGFQAFMRGKDDFARWWDSPEAANFRSSAQVVERGSASTMTSRAPTMDEVYQGWETLWDVLRTNVPEGELSDWTAAWVRATEEARTTGRNVSMPAWVFDEGRFIPVRGAQKVQKSGAFGEWTETFFDRLFMDPVNYRRGFVAEMVRQTERVRLEKLLASQGKKIIPDDALASAMREGGWNIPDGHAGQELVQRAWMDSKFVPESYITETIEKTVTEEIENLLYKWNTGSQVGASMKPIYPFGKPYADMASFWGRETMKQPVLRGLWNQDNFLNMENIAKSMPFNPKPAALISRLAATDMEVERGWIPFDGEDKEGLLPGSESSDFSPLVFLPTEGEDLLGSVLPGMGYIPMIALDMVLTHIGPDPVEEPGEYNQWVDNISYTLPYFEYQQGGTLSRVFGGGTAASAVGFGADVLGYGLAGNPGQTFYNITSEVGDIGREIRRNRELGVLLSDPDTLAELESVEDPETLELLLAGIVDEANQAASSSHGAEVLARWSSPARTTYDNTSAELQDVWLQANKEFDIMDLDDYRLDTKEGQRQAAADVRDLFFDLPRDEQNLMVTKNPALAVNLVSSWDWTPKAINEGLPGSDLPYSTGGAPDDLLRHDYYVTNGFVRPIQPAERARLILGLVAESRDKALKNVYETTVGSVNDVIWEETIANEPQRLGYFEQLHAEFGEEFGLATPRDLWNHWYSVESMITRGATDEEGEEINTLGLPADYKPWSSTWPGLEGATQRFNDIGSVQLDEELQRKVDLLGLDISTGMTGRQLYSALQEPLSQNEALVYGVAEASWRGFTQERLAFSQSAETQMNKAKNNPRNDDEWRLALQDWQFKVTNVLDEWKDSPKGVPAQLRQEIVDDYQWFVSTSKDNKIPWDLIWDGKYKGVFGERDWTPPEPASPFLEDGRTKSAHTTVPFLHDIVDGDTIVFSEERGGDLYEVRLLGVDGREFANDPDGALEDTERLEAFIERAEENGDTLYLVRDPDRYVTNTDRYGRMLAWLWAGDEPFYFTEEMNPKFTPSGGDK